MTDDLNAPAQPTPPDASPTPPAPLPRPVPTLDNPNPLRVDLVRLTDADIAAGRVDGYDVNALTILAAKGIRERARAAGWSEDKLVEVERDYERARAAGRSPNINDYRAREARLKGDPEDRDAAGRFARP